MNGVFIFLLLMISILPVQAQDVNSLIEKVYLQNLEQDSLLENMAEYSYQQRIEFTKLDNDDDIDEQSRREFTVYARGMDILKRVLVSAQDFKDGEWHEITDLEEARKEESRSKKFSLGEMVSPENRSGYRFSYIGREKYAAYDVEHIRVESIEEDEEKFNGDLWIQVAEFNVIKAGLVPSELPTGLKSMRMDFEMAKFGQVWLPVRIDLKAEISFLLIFSGKIESTITFEDYKFNQHFEDQLFGEQ